MTYLLSEDAGLREKLQGMTVSDQKSSDQSVARKVGVWFGMPDQEIRDQSYPYVTIEMLEVNRDVSREHRGVAYDDYLRGDIPENTPFKTQIPVPVYIDYQITTFARHPRHDRQIMAQLTAQKLPIRAGVLELDDGTVRRLDVLQVVKRDQVEQNKRLFMNAITVRVSSEIPPQTLTELNTVGAINFDPITDEELVSFDFTIQQQQT